MNISCLWGRKLDWREKVARPKMLMCVTIHMLGEKTVRSVDDRGEVNIWGGGDGEKKGGSGRAKWMESQKGQERGVKWRVMGVHGIEE